LRRSEATSGVALLTASKASGRRADGGDCFTEGEAAAGVTLTVAIARRRRIVAASARIGAVSTRGRRMLGGVVWFEA
jgi:hypothetical protein